MILAHLIMSIGAIRNSLRANAGYSLLECGFSGIVGRRRRRRWEGTTCVIWHTLREDFGEKTLRRYGGGAQQLLESKPPQRNVVIPCYTQKIPKE